MKNIHFVRSEQQEVLDTVRIALLLQRYEFDGAVARLTYRLDQTTEDLQAAIEVLHEQQEGREE